jgi:hypothetical protein
MGDLGTYEILDYVVHHPMVGDITKQKIVYYDKQNQKEFDEFYFGYIREGYNEKNN